MNIQFNDEDFNILEEAKRLKDWKVLTTWKQRFMYQRYIALPHDVKTAKEIGLEAKKIVEQKNTTEQQELIKTATDIMNSK